jgi:4-hydroxy-tetrahydrodipicolinate synthase
MEILRGRPEGFRVISGDDSLTLALIALGGEGLISVASNEAPEMMSRLNDLALAGQWDEARALHYRLLPLMEGKLHRVESWSSESGAGADGIAGREPASSARAGAGKDARACARF